jgi:TonB C terminal
MIGRSRYRIQDKDMSAPESRVLGMSGALSLHLVLFAFLGTRVHPLPVPHAPMPFGAENGAADGFRTVAFLLDGATQERSQPNGALANTIVMSPITLESSALPMPNSVGEIEQSSAENAALGDPAQAEEFARLRGIYFTQVHARVDRAWEKPANVGVLLADRHCTALVLQDPNGSVLEVELADCPADAALQQSIVSAVFRASPLPAPPHPTVFAKRLRISFDLR